MVNTAILDGFVRHQIALMRLANGYVRTFMRELVQAQREISVLVGALIERHPGSVETLIASIRQIIGRQSDVSKAAIASELSDLAVYEASATINIIDAALPVAVHLDFTRPTAQQLIAILTTPLAGRPFEDWFDAFEARAMDRIGVAVRAGIAQGLTTPAIVGSVRDTYDIDRRNAETIVRTMVSAVSHDARDITLRSNGGLFSGVLWVSTLDNRTSEICQDRDGNVYPISSGPRPPAHPNCRSTITPILRDAASLGLPKTTRASMNGQVPEDMTYGEWLKRQPTSVQDEVLGKTRAELFRSGGIAFDRFFNDQSHYYSLDQLRQREAKAFKRAGLG